MQVFGIIFTICQGKIIDHFGTLPGNIFLCVFLLIGTIMTGKTFMSHNQLLILHMMKPDEAIERNVVCQEFTNGVINVEFQEFIVVAV